MSLLDARDSVLFVHAHPDDETISTGALIAELVARNIRVFLLTATRGERGEVVPGPLANLHSVSSGNSGWASRPPGPPAVLHAATATPACGGSAPGSPAR